MSLLMQATINRNMLHHNRCLHMRKVCGLAQYHTSTHKDNIHKMNNNSLAFRQAIHTQQTKNIHKIGLPYTDNRHAIYTQQTSNLHTRLPSHTQLTCHIQTVKMRYISVPNYTNHKYDIDVNSFSSCSKKELGPFPPFILT